MRCVFTFMWIFSPLVLSPPAITCMESEGSCRKRQKAQAPIRNRQTRKVENAKVRNRNTNLT